MAGRKDEMKMWEDWKKSKDPHKLNNLLTSYRPMIKSTVRKWSGGGISDSVLRAKAEVQAVKAFKSYNPNKGTSLGTHVFNNMKKVSRVVYENQNVARIPEHRITKIGTYQNVKSFLEGKYDREPTSSELSTELGWSLKDVNKMERALKQDLLVSNDLLSDYSMQSTFEDEEARDIVDFIYYELSPREKTVFEYLTGKYGKPKLSAGEIAKKMRVSDATVSRIRKSIEKKIVKHRGY
jgi:RNA polymerase sigma factor (sigma-70 family)